MFGTAGLYTPIPQTLADSVFASLPKSFDFGGRTWKLGEVSRRGAEGLRGCSVYYHTRHNAELMRISDHWNAGRWDLMSSETCSAVQGGILAKSYRR